MERWSPVDGYEGLYEISDAGRVQSVPRTRPSSGGRTQRISGQILKASSSSGGYRFVTLSDANCERRQFYVHRLVAIAFIANPDARPDVNHIDFDKANNAASNLEWVTPKQNTRHSIEAGRWDGMHRNGQILAKNNPARAQKLTASDVAEIRAACARGERQADIGKRFGIQQCSVSRIKRDASWSHTVRNNRPSRAA